MTPQEIQAMSAFVMILLAVISWFIVRMVLEIHKRLDELEKADEVHHLHHAKHDDSYEVE